MPRFTYTARDRSGAAASAALEAPSRKDALRLLTARGLQVSRLIEDGAGAAKKSAAKNQSRTNAAAADATATSARAGQATAAAAALPKGTPALTRREQLPFLQSLHDLTSSGMSAGEAVRLLALRIKEPKLRALCRMLWDRLSEGAPLSRAMDDLPQVFPRETTNLFQAGEATGNLNDTLERLISHLVQQRELRREFLSALAYPALMVFVAAGVILFFLFFLLPRLQTLLTSLGGELPFATQLLVGLSDFALRFGPFLVIGAIVGGLFFWQWRRSAAGRAATDAWALRLPMLAEFVINRTVLAFSQTLSVLLANGITTAEALRMTERQITNTAHRAAFSAATDRIIEGESLSVALARTGCLPDLALDQLAVGENTGNIVPALQKLTKTYQRRIADQLQGLTKIVATGVLLTVFVFVAFIAYAIVSAVFAVSSSFKFGG